ncbi:hypothetical protein D1872_338590 [compost metagenome]
MVKTAADPNKQIMMPAFSRVERWLARWIAKIDANDITSAKKPNSKSKICPWCTLRITLARMLNRIEQM